MPPPHLHAEMTHTVPVPLLKKRIYSLLPMFHLVVWVQWCYSPAPLFHRFHSLQILALWPPTFFPDYLGFLPVNPCIAYRAVFRQSTVVVVHSFVGLIHIPSSYVTLCETDFVFVLLLARLLFSISLSIIRANKRMNDNDGGLAKHSTICNAGIDWEKAKIVGKERWW